jgi:plasmid stabilization system protein ParE
VSFRVVLTTEAADQARAITDWWRESRPGSPDKFEQELGEMVEQLTRSPLPAQVYRRHPLAYRTLLRVTQNHVYFTVDSAARVVTILSIWGGPGRRGPRLPRK